MSEMSTIPPDAETSANGTRHPAPEGSPDTAPLQREERVSVMYGDRLCTKCHYNLIGQPILREPHYGMFIARCPECATVAALQEYPQLGRWAHRWAVILSTFWVLVILAITLMSTPPLIISMAEFGDLGARPYRSALGDHWEAWYEAEFDKPPNTNSWNPDKFDEWVAANPPAETLAGMGGFWEVTSSLELFFIIVPMGIAFTYGCFLSVALVHRRRRTLFLITLTLLFLVGAVYGTAWYQINVYNSIDSFGDLSFLQIEFPLRAIGIVGVWFLLVTGVLFGRSIVRGLVRILLPPKMRGSLAVLWTTDGMLPPTKETSVA
ncbi:MAG: hypothetical protein O7G85_14965 [Planctomycetota bacterium]|nr:hypothetical protein [Planctomycetota bacterium]